jgi:hypothetical protein
VASADPDDRAAPGRAAAVVPPAPGAVAQDTLRELLPGADAAAYAGVPAVTFDTERRVGCTWTSATTDSTQRLSVDLTRVVSYDPAVSDDAQAEQDFRRRMAAAPAAREVDGIGHVAYIDTALTSDDAGNGDDITLAFRTANVIVTVDYAVSTVQADAAPRSALLQQRVQSVARQLAGGFDG